MSQDCPQTRTGKELSEPLHRRVHLAADQFPGSHPHHSRVCPRLTQPQSGRRSRNLRRSVHRSSRTCSRPRMSSLNCGKGARHIAPLPNCSRNIACRPARRPSLRSAIKSLAKLCGLADDRGENARLFRLLQTAASRPVARPAIAGTTRRQSHPQTPTVTKLHPPDHAGLASRKCGCSNLKAHETSCSHP